MTYNLRLNSTWPLATVVNILIKQHTAVCPALIHHRPQNEPVLGPTHKSTFKFLAPVWLLGWKFNTHRWTQWLAWISNLMNQRTRQMTGQRSYFISRYNPASRLCNPSGFSNKASLYLKHYSLRLVFTLRTAALGQTHRVYMQIYAKVTFIARI